ncbi:MAG TPA: hypothetical protein DDW52_23150 [Planctomycetaceae bacterium]|nr:hypothetical protein [Planctomycetaceae bacterium]
MLANDLKPYTNLALPSRPVLNFDPSTGHGYVTFRHATWVSHEWGFHVGKWLGRLLVLFGAFWLWGQWEETDLFIRIVLVLLLVLLLGRGVVTIVRRSFQGFFARQFFCHRLRVWFTPSAIAIQSHLFPLGLRFRRRWKEQSIHARFVIAPSASAALEHQGLRQRAAIDTAHFMSARILRLVLSSDTRRQVRQVGRSTAQRAITIADIDAEDAERLCAVLQAANALSVGGVLPKASSHQETSSRGQPCGQDIDC